MKQPKNTILITFGDKELADYVRFVCRRKGINLAAYILDNFEWDDRPACFLNPDEKITVETCIGCDYIKNCPDAQKEKVY